MTVLRPIQGLQSVPFLELQAPAFLVDLVVYAPGLATKSRFRQDLCQPEVLTTQ